MRAPNRPSSLPDRDRPLIMGILNVTPDSFYDGGRFFGREEAVRRGLELVSEGADMIDIGGESTRPGARDVPAEEESSRVIPVIEALAGKVPVPISIDTRKAAVAERALAAGAVIINDVSGLRHDARMAAVAASAGAFVILMHMRGAPSDMQTKATYGDVVAEVKAEIGQMAASAKAAGIAGEKIMIDPGIGFAKTAEQSMAILRRLDEFVSMGYPVCVGVSRKSFIGHALGEPDAADRLPGTLAACTIAAMKGARILRVHDVKEVKPAVAMAVAIAAG